MSVRTYSGRKLLAVLLGLMLAVGMFGAASADVPIPVNADLDVAGWDDGVFVQHVNVAGEYRGDWILVACHIHIQTAVEGVGETMTATDGDGNVYSEFVQGRFAPGTRDVVAGRFSRCHRERC